MKVETILRAGCLFLVVAGAGCSVTTTSSTCGPDSTVSCAGGAGYSCTGSDTPDESDSTLICSQGEAGNAGSTIYCCADAFPTTSSCEEDPTVSGCEPPSIGFSCASTDTPTDADPTLNCSAGTPGNAGSTLYCCE
jgi:hypothetical protein